MPAKTILTYGRSGSGKSTLATELAEHVKVTTGKNTRVYTADKGGVGPMLPYIELGIIELVEQQGTDPWVFLNKAVRGFVRDANGKWIQKDNSNIGLYVFESMTAFAEALMTSLAEKAAQGVNVGGSANVNFSVSGDGETLKVGGSNMAHYNIVQNRLTEEIWMSQKLPADYVLWTASVSKDDDSSSNTKVLGPQVVGKALTAEIPRWFSWTFRLDVIPAQQGKPEKHVLYLGSSLDVAAGNATSLGNVRLPLGAAPLPTSIEPASLVKAIQMIESAQQEAIDRIKTRLQTKG